MAMTTSNSPDEIRASVSSIYAGILSKRKTDAEDKAERKRLEKEEKRERKEQKKVEKEEEGGEKLSKKERAQKNLDSWKEVIIGLTGDDLDYSDEKKKGSKKYKKWIDDDGDNKNQVLNDKPKKQKKKNYHKEFEPELNMLKSLVADQNRFTTDIMKRFQAMAGPATKDGQPLNKTLVDMIATINASRKNSLDMLNAIGNAKKTIADLYMKQKKLEADLGGTNVGSSADLGLMGSSIASSLFGDSAPTPTWNSIPPGTPMADSSIPTNASNLSNGPIVATSTVSGVAQGPGVLQGSSFDPDTWEGPDLGANASVAYEAIPHHVVVEWHESAGKARFKAIRDDNGEELIGAPVPTSDASKLTFNKTDMKVKGEFDEVYPLEII